MKNSNDKQNRQDHRNEEELKIQGPAGSTLQTPAEHRHDQQVDPTKDTTMEPSNDDLHKTDIDRFRETVDGKRGDIPEIDDTLSNQKD